MSTHDIHEAVRERYAAAAREAASGERPGHRRGLRRGWVLRPG